MINYATNKLSIKNGGWQEERNLGTQARAVGVTNMGGFPAHHWTRAQMESVYNLRPTSESTRAGYWSSRAETDWLIFVIWLEPPGVIRLDLVIFIINFI